MRDCSFCGGEPALCEEANLPAPALSTAYSRIRKEHGRTEGEAFKEKAFQMVLHINQQSPLQSSCASSNMQVPVHHLFPREDGRKI